MTTQTSTYTWRTDAASGEIYAFSAHEALTQLIVLGEWAAPGSPREDRDIDAGAWLTIFDADGVAVLRRGVMP